MSFKLKVSSRSHDAGANCGGSSSAGLPQPVNHHPTEFANRNLDNQNLVRPHHGINGSPGDALVELDLAVW